VVIGRTSPREIYSFIPRIGRNIYFFFFEAGVAGFAGNNRHISDFKVRFNQGKVEHSAYQAWMQHKKLIINALIGWDA
jgi:hypothetical protein